MFFFPHEENISSKPGLRYVDQTETRRKPLQVIVNATAPHVSVISGKPKVHPIISEW